MMSRRGEGPARGFVAVAERLIVAERSGANALEATERAWREMPAGVVPGHMKTGLPNRGRARKRIRDGDATTRASQWPCPLPRPVRRYVAGVALEPGRACPPRNSHLLPSSPIYGLPTRLSSEQPRDMLDAPFLAPLLVLLLCAAFYALAVPRDPRRRLPLPPGPKTSLLGASSALPKRYPWKVYAEWRRTYGDVIYIRVFGNPILVINSAKAAADLLDKRSSIYSSRPYRTMVSNLMGWDWLFSTIPYGPRWKQHRTLFHHYFNTTTSPAHHPIQTKETSVMLQNLLTTPGNLPHHIRRTAAAIIMQIIYGHQVAPEGDVFVTLADRALETLGHAGLFGTYLVDYIPLRTLRHLPAWIPGAAFKRKAREWRKLNRAMLNEPYEMVKERTARGTAVPCFATAEVEKWAQSGQDPAYEKLIKGVAATAYAAGADTTVSAIQSFFLAATVYPDMFKRCQAEIDRAVGPDRLPTFADRARLPYIDWVVWECLRWNPVAPLGVAHSVTDDDVYEGRRIPRGTTVLPNVWGILHDEQAYPDPLRFAPERYADAEVNADTNANAPPLAAFGFGRRMCPGRWLAVDSIWLAIAAVAAVFDVAKKLDEHGCPIEPSVEYSSTMLSRPPPFPCAITPRSEAARKLVEVYAG
ncbi:cytochrome P450 [Daedalea quercina L-15889]|uniref:Cytochrome P450 n=1 Tax=Daedalea quercina L-15889 TaxID=1314783 RepID=A0A165T0T2_9APHY|nr:cytochrome P450 [Daedalea quercina L-15889]